MLTSSSITFEAVRRMRISPFTLGKALLLPIGFPFPGGCVVQKLVVLLFVLPKCNLMQKLFVICYCAGTRKGVIALRFRMEPKRKASSRSSI